MNRIIVFTTGLPGAGKGVFAQVASEMGIPVVVMGDAVRKEAKKRGIEITPQNLRRLARELRNEEGPLAIAKRVEEEVYKLLEENCIVLVDGARSLDEVNYFRKVGEVIIIAIEAPIETRFERIKKRGRPDDPTKIDDLIQRDRVESEIGVEDLIKNADIILMNVGSLEEYKEKIKRLLREISLLCN